MAGVDVPETMARADEDSFRDMGPGRVPTTEDRDWRQTLDHLLEQERLLQTMEPLPDDLTVRTVAEQEQLYLSMQRIKQRQAHPMLRAMRIPLSQQIWVPGDTIWEAGLSHGNLLYRNLWAKNGGGVRLDNWNLAGVRHRSSANSRRATRLPTERRHPRGRPLPHPGHDRDPHARGAGPGLAFRQASLAGPYRAVSQLDSEDDGIAQPPSRHPLAMGRRGSSPATQPNRRLNPQPGYGVAMPDSRPSRAGRPRDPGLDAALLTATARLIAERGYSAVTLQAVADEASTSRPALYRRFSDRAELVLSVLIERFGLQPGAADLDGIEAEMLAIQRHQVALFNDPVLRNAMPGLLEELSRSRDFARRFHERFLEPRRVSTASILDRAVARGEIAAGTDPEWICDLITGPMLMRALIPTLGPIDESLVQLTVRAALDAVGYRHS